MAHRRFSDTLERARDQRKNPSPAAIELSFRRHAARARPEVSDAFADATSL